MKIVHSKIIPLNGIPSGSGIAKAGDNYYVIGDDAPYLFTLNADYKLISKTLLLENNNNSDLRISKAAKADLESMEMINEKEMIIFGSGSKSPQRNICLHLLFEEKWLIHQFNITDLYQKLQILPEFENAALNIEGTAYYKGQLFLLNRKKNLLIQFEYLALLSFIKGDAPFPIPKIKQYALPTINGIEAGFTGATAFKNESKIIFTAAVENTDNPYDDGEILGSFIGLIDISHNEMNAILVTCPIPNTADKIKVESVTIIEEKVGNKAKLLLITDDDLGSSIIIESELHL